MKKKLFGMIFLMGFSTLAFADLNGKWIGQGEWNYEGSGTHCFMHMKFLETKESITRTSGLLDCDYITQELDSVSYKRNGDLLINEQNEVVGSYANNVLKLTEQYSDTVSVHTTIVVNGYHFDYQEKWLNKSGDLIYDINGRLFTSTHE